VPRSVAAVLLVAALAGVARGAAATPLLERIVLTPAQVGAGYRMRMLPQGDVVKHQVSLDLCDFAFPSDGLRTGRLQVAYLHGGHVPQISNEVLSYTAGGTKAALAELNRALATCPARPMTGPVSGSVPTTHRLSRLVVPHLSLAYVAVHDQASARIRGKTVRRSAVAVYEVRRNVLSAIYSDGTGSLAAQEELTFHAANASARNLTRALP
jgi:hypothetical protein